MLLNKFSSYPLFQSKIPLNHIQCPKYDLKGHVKRHMEAQRLGTEEQKPLSQAHRTP